MIARKRSSGAYFVQVAIGGSRRTVTLGRISKSKADQAAANLTRLIECREYSEELPRDLLAWLATLSGELVDRLVEVGVIKRRFTSPTLGEVIELFEASYRERADIKPISCERVATSLNRVPRWLREVEYDSIEPEQVERFQASLKGYAADTIGRSNGHLRQVALWAKKRQLVKGNPFSDLVCRQTGNEKRRRHVPAQDVRDIAAVSSNKSLRLVLILARFSALRIPTELLRLKWKDIDFEKNEMTVRNSKRKEGRSEKLFKTIPLFADVRNALLEQQKSTGKAEFVFDVEVLRQSEATLRIAARRAIARAGFEPWPKVFQNLRSSCETDWMNHPQIGLFKATEWAGNSPEIALKHYATKKRGDSDAASKLDPFE